MKKINEASTLSALGLSSEHIKGIHSIGPAQIPHDIEYRSAKTKSEALAHLKQGHLMVGINTEGDAVSIRFDKRRLRDKYYQVILSNGKSKITGSLKDALAFLPGKASWYISTERVRGEQGSETQKEWSGQEEFIENIANNINRIYGKKLRAEARKHAQEIRRSVGSAITQDKRKKDYGYRGPTATDSVAALKRGYDKLDSIAKSKTPFEALSKAIRGEGYTDNRHGFTGMISAAISDYRPWSGHHSTEPKHAGKWAQENPAATAKIVRYALSKLRSIRDDAFDSYHKQKDPIEADPYKLRVKEAYDRFGETGEVTSITKDKK